MAKTNAHRAKAVKARQAQAKPHGKTAHVGYRMEVISTGNEFIAADEYTSMDAYEVYETVQGVIGNRDY